MKEKEKNIRQAFTEKTEQPLTVDGNRIGLITFGVKACFLSQECKNRDNRVNTGSPFSTHWGRRYLGHGDPDTSVFFNSVTAGRRDSGTECAPRRAYHIAGENPAE